MKYIITESQTESLRKLFLGLIFSKGFVVAVKMAGGIKNLLEIIGDKVPPKIMVKTIKNLVTDFTNKMGVRLLSMDEHDLIIYEDENYFKRIEILTPDSAVVYMYGLPDYTDLNEYDLYYEEMDVELLTRLYNILIDYYPYFYETR